MNKAGEVNAPFTQVDFRGTVKITHIRAITTTGDKKVTSFQLITTDKKTQTFTFANDKTLQVFPLAKPVSSESARFVLTGGDQVSFGVEVIGIAKDDKPLVAISDKAYNDKVTCSDTEGNCASGLISKMVGDKMEGEGWSCTKGVGCSLDIVFGADFEMHTFSILQRQTQPHLLVSKYIVTINSEEQEFKMDSKQAANRQTFRLKTPVTSGAIQFKVKSISGDQKTDVPLGGHFVVYGHAKTEEDKKEQVEVSKVPA